MTTTSGSVRTIARAMAVLSLPLWFFACGDDHGGPYGPYMEAPCRADFDCGPGTSCADFAGGTCLMACRSDVDCGPGYDCKDTDRRGAGGKVRVCVPK